MRIYLNERLLEGKETAIAGVKWQEPRARSLAVMREGANAIPAEAAIES